MSKYRIVEVEKLPKGTKFYVEKQWLGVWLFHGDRPFSTFAEARRYVEVCAASPIVREVYDVHN
jgi:hypothetical protein